MRKYLAIQMMTHTTEAPVVTSQQLKSWYVENNQVVIPGLLDPQELVKREATEEIYQKAYDRVHSSSEFFAKIGVENKHSTIRAMDSETNGRIRRYVIAEQQMKKPSA